MATGTGIINVDKAVQAVVEHCDVDTVYDPPAETPPTASPSAVDAPELVDPSVIRPALPSASNVETLVDLPEDFPVDGLLTAEPVPETVSSRPDSVSLVTSPMGASLVDSDDEMIATRLPGYLNSFKTC